MKKLLIGFAFVTAAITSQGAYMFWTITNDQLPECADGWDKAVIKGGKDAKSLSVLNIEDDDKTYTSIGSVDGNAAGPVAVNLGSITSGDLAAYSYYIELLNSNNELVAYKKGTYSDFSGAIVYADSYADASTMMASITPWHGGMYNAPEPTSAMLMLLGVAGLALRRKQRKLA